MGLSYDRSVLFLTDEKARMLCVLIKNEKIMKRGDNK